MFDVGIVLINYNSSKYTVNCIKSILTHTSTALKTQIIVVDNASENEDYAYLKSTISSQFNSPHLKLIRSKINTGFGGGNMFGAQFITAKYIAFINNDSIFKNDCLSLLKQFMDNTPNAGVCGPQAFKENGELLPTLDHFTSAAKLILKRKVLERINPKKYVKRKQKFTTPTRGQFVAGSFMFFKTSDFNNIGGFDTNLFLYHEETDICRRLLKQNKYAYVVPQAEFTHYHGVSTKSSILIKQEQKLSAMYVIKKHCSYLEYLIVLVYFQISFLFKALFKPKYWTLFSTFIQGASLAKSLRHKQSVLF